ncbi:MAG: CvpA family protein [Clostridiales bacterium]|nr:CvpA family protein [Clostridiales bacterium]
MNPIDIIALILMAVCLVYGLYRGFIQSVLNLGGGLLSLLASFWIFPRLADAISQNMDITRLISSFTDSQSLLGDLDLSSLPVSGLSGDAVAQIVERANLPTPINTILQHNLQSQVFSPMGNLVSNVGDYVNQTLISVSINVLCFLVCFILCYVAISMLINLLRAVFRFPALKHLDAIAGGIFGLMTGILICYAAFTLLPLLESVMPIEGFREMAESSVLGKAFAHSNLILSIMNRKL